MNQDIKTIMDTLFKFRGTSCSKVAEKLGMSRQVLFRMINGGTLKLDVFMRILDVLDFKMDFQSESDDVSRIMRLNSFSGPRIKRKIKGVVYDTDKIFSVAVGDYENHVRTELCYDSVRDVYLLAMYSDDGSFVKGKRQATLEIIDDDKAEELLDSGVVK